MPVCPRKEKSKTTLLADLRGKKAFKKLKAMYRLAPRGGAFINY